MDIKSSSTLFFEMGSSSELTESEPVEMIDLGWLASKLQRNTLVSASLALGC